MNNPSDANANNAGGADTDGTPHRPRPRRKKILSFDAKYMQPNADFFVIDESTPAETAPPAQQRARQRSHEGRKSNGGDDDAHPAAVATPELMGPVLRRKKVVSMPLGATNDFFFGDRRGQPIPAAIDEVSSTIEEGSDVGAIPQVQTRTSRFCA